MRSYLTAGPTPVMVKNASGFRVLAGHGPKGRRMVKLATHLGPAVQTLQNYAGNRRRLSSLGQQVMRDVSAVSPYSAIAQAAHGTVLAGVDIYGQYRSEQEAKRAAQAVERQAREAEERARWKRWASRVRAKAKADTDRRFAIALNRAEQMENFFLPMDGAGFLFAGEADPFNYVEYDKKAQAQRQRRRNKKRKIKMRNLKEQVANLETELENQAAAFSESAASLQAAYEAGAITSAAQAQAAGESSYYDPRSGSWGWDDPEYYGPGTDDEDDQYPAWDPDDPSEFFDAVCASNPGLFHDLEEAADLAYSGAVVSSSHTDNHDSPTNCRFQDYGPTTSFRGAGTFYESNLVTAKLVPSLGSGIHGQIDLNQYPAQIMISSSSGPARARITLGHEIAHLLNSSLKLGNSHDQVHSMGLMLASEGFPAMQALEDFVRRAP